MSNYELTLKGTTPFRKGHNYGFVVYCLANNPLKCNQVML